jgi:MraZ protein
VENQAQISVTSVESVEPPRGLYPGKLDEKGRLKLPADFIRYFKDLGAEKLFVTSINKTTAQIYTIPTWRVNEKLLATTTVNKAAAKDLLLIANWLGGDADIDGQGRVLFNTVIRKELELDGQGLHLQVMGEGRVDVMTESRFASRLGEALAKSEANIDVLEKEGFR